MDSRSRHAAEARPTRRDVELPGFGAGWRAWLEHNALGTWCGYVRLDRAAAAAVLQLTEETAGVHGGITRWAEIYRSRGSGAEVQRVLPEPARAAEMTMTPAEMAAMDQAMGMPPGSVAQLQTSIAPPPVPEDHELVAYVLGFDASHADDWFPHGGDAPGRTYRDAAYMARCCRRLAAAMRACLPA